jgi:hypothetical protein
MKWLIMLLLLIPMVEATHTTDHSKLDDHARMLRNVDMLRPIRYHRDFNTAKKLVYADLDAYLKNSSNSTYMRLNTSLTMLGEIGGYTHPNVCRTKIRSIPAYRHIRQYIAVRSLKDWHPFYCAQQTRPRPLLNVTIVPR